MISPLGLLLGVAVTAGVLFGLPGIVLAPMLLLVFVVVIDDTPAHARQLGRPVVLLLIAGLLGAGRGAMVSPLATTEIVGETTGGWGKVVSLPQPAQRGERVIVEISQVVDREGRRQPVDTRVLAILPTGEQVNIGDHLWMAWEYKSLDAIAPGFSRFVRTRQASAVVYVHTVDREQTGRSPWRRLVDVRRAVSDRLLTLIPGDAGALAAGIVSGDDSALSDEAFTAFQRTGTSHITAVSGQNIGMLIGLWMVMIRPIRRRQAWAIQTGIIASIWLYAVITGLNPPSVRAALFGTFVLLAARTGRRPDPATILAIVTAIMVLVNPGYLQDVSFWLSVAASAALVTGMQFGFGRMRRTVLASLVTVVAAQLATLPLSVAIFGMWSPGSIVANLLVLPLVAIAFPLVLALTIVAFVAPSVAASIAQLPTAILRLIVALVEWTSGMFPARQLDANGLPVAFALIIPCVLGICLLSVDAQRWSTRLGIQVRRDPALVSLALIGGVAGVSVIVFFSVMG